MRIETYNEPVRKNKQTILKKLKELKAEQVVVAYSGSGDSGQIDDVTIMPSDDIIKNAEVTQELPRSYFDHDKTVWVNTVVSEKVSLKEAIKQLCYDLLESEHSDWENNSGADGEFNFDIESGKIILAHKEYYTENITHESEW